MLMPITNSLREALTAVSEARLIGASPDRALVQGCRVCSSSHRALIWAFRTRIMASFLFSASSKPVIMRLVRTLTMMTLLQAGQVQSQLPKSSMICSDFTEGWLPTDSKGAAHTYTHCALVWLTCQHQGLL